MGGNFEAQFKSNNNGKVYTAAPMMKEGKWDVAEVGILTHPAFVEAFSPEGGRESRLVAEMEAEIAAPKIPAVAPSVDVEKPALSPEVAATLEAEELPPVAEVEPELEPLPEPEPETEKGTVTTDYSLPNGDPDLDAIRTTAAEETAAHEAELAAEELAEEAEAPAEPAPAPVTDEEISASEAIELVKIEKSVEALEVWLKNDDRKSVKRAARKRMKELQE